MQYTEYDLRLSVGDQQIFTPYLDLVGPLYFLPKHCTARRGIDYASPLVAIIRDGNSIEQDIVEQLEVLFETQRDLVKLLFGAQEGDEAATLTLLRLFGADELSRTALIDNGVDPGLATFVTEMTFGDSDMFSDFNALNETGILDDLTPEQRANVRTAITLNSARDDF